MIRFLIYLFLLWKGKNIWITRASAFVTTIIIAIIVVVCCHYGWMHIRLFIYLFIYIFLCIYICTYFQKLCHCYVSYICMNICCCCYCLVFCYLSSYIYIYIYIYFFFSIYIYMYFWKLRPFVVLCVNPFKTLSQTSGWLLLPVITAIPLACLFKTGFHVSQCNPRS